MKIKKNKNMNLMFNINKLEKVSKTNIYKIINILSKRANKIYCDINLFLKKINLQCFSLKKEKKNKIYIYLKNKIKKINELPCPSNLSILELLNKKLIYKYKGNGKKNK
ncbi:MAG: hypothetical protein NHF96_01025 [Candidatus Shikimatogenerans bostrichidophilus]|nr:MAG: hypothetical protein NHF96_01025 [Candidatus Shikimatogenerans bostrichidophilus]